jgi:hypothetical protein
MHIFVRIPPPVTEQVGIVVALSTYIQEALGLNLDWNAAIWTNVFFGGGGFPQSLKANVRITLFMLSTLPSKLFPIPISLLLFSAI